MMLKHFYRGGVALGAALTFSLAPVAHADTVSPPSKDSEWAAVDARIDADLAAGKLTSPKDTYQLRTQSPTPVSDRALSIAPASSSSPGTGKPKGTGTTTGNIGTYPTRKGVILVTPDFAGGVVPTGHAGIVYSKDQAIESINSGVKVMSNKWYVDKSQAYGVTVKSTSGQQDANAADWARRQVGKPYNWNFADVKTRSKFYCSQLVWAAFKDTAGVDLNKSSWGAAIHPMELVDNPATTVIYRMRPA